MSASLRRGLAKALKIARSSRFERTRLRRAGCASCEGHTSGFLEAHGAVGQGLSVWQDVRADAYLRVAFAEWRRARAAPLSPRWGDPGAAVEKRHQPQPPTALESIPLFSRDDESDVQIGRGWPLPRQAPPALRLDGHKRAAAPGVRVSPGASLWSVPPQCF